MNIIAYNHGTDFVVDYAPESFLNIGACTLMSITAADNRMIKAMSQTGPAHGGFDFDIYVEDCKAFNKIKHRNATILNEANRRF